MKISRLTLRVVVIAFSAALMQAQVVQKARSVVANTSSGAITPAVASSEKTFVGRLTCAGLASHSYNCGKNQTIWACTLQCAGEQSHYVLETADGQLLPITGKLDQLQHFAADKVVVSGDVSDSGLNVRSIEKSSAHGNSPATASGQ